MSIADAIIVAGIMITKMRLIDVVNMQPTIEPKKNKCNHEHCPLQYNYVSDDCDISECSWRTVGKQGHWIISSDGYYPYCSECKSEPKSGEMTDFCPSCGAYMIKK